MFMQKKTTETRDELSQQVKGEFYMWTVQEKYVAGWVTIMFCTISKLLELEERI